MSNSGKRDPWLGVRDMLAFPVGMVVVVGTVTLAGALFPIAVVALRWAWGLM